LEQSPGATVCSVSIATSFGDAGAEGFSFAATDLGARVGASLQMASTDTNAAPVLAQLVRGGCQGVVTTLAPQQLVQLVMGAARAGLPFRWIILGAGFSDRIITPQTSKTFEASCWVIGDGPVWGEKETVSLAADLLAADHRYWTENPDVGLTFGYTQARVWEAVLERAVALGDLSRAGLLSASRSVGSVDTGGLGSPIDYSQPIRLSAPRASIYAVDGSYRNSIRLLNAVYTAPSAARFKLR
jgi:ABC-type branched-subunit amino acid transport system substrate-binding protein